MSELVGQKSGRGYLSELGQHPRAMVAAAAGMGAGYLINHYVANLFAPHLLEEFGWSRADFAFIGTLGLVTLILIPFVGRLTDVIGVKPIAVVGVVSFPLTFIAFSMMSGSLIQFAGITVVQTVLAGVTTSSLVYSRLVAERFKHARGLALAIMATMPALAGVVGSPLLDEVIETEGWRAGYLAVAAYTAILGGLAITLMPGRIEPGERAGSTTTKKRAKNDYGEIFRSGTFRVIASAFLLCNLIYPLQSSQMRLMLLEAGATASTAAWMISLLAAGVMAGRILCGLALDRFPAPIVAAIALGAPGVGLFAIAAGFTATPFLAASVLIMGLSLGAESDLAAYLVMRYFRIEIYGSVLGLVVTSIAISAALGAVVLSATLAIADHFSLYMLIAGASCITGATLFLLLGRKSAIAVEAPA